MNRIKNVAESNECIPHMPQILNVARDAGLHIFYALHRRYRPGDYETWKYITPHPKTGIEKQGLKDGTWGGEIRNEFTQSGEIVAQLCC